MNSVHSKRRVVITGCGMVTPLGRDCRETFENARQGKSGITFLRTFDPAGLPCRIGGQIPDDWPGNEQLEGNPPQGWEKYASRGFRLMWAASSQAVRQAGLNSLTDRDRIGVALGHHGENPPIDDLRILHAHLDGNGSWDLKGLSEDRRYSLFQFFRRKPDVATSLLSLFFDCRGSTLSIVSACAAGAQAIGEATRLIRSGRADVMLAGGSEASLDFMGFIGFVLIRALVEKYPSPEKASRPFDRKRNGFVMSEGAGAVILEDLEHARARGAPILGEILGYGASADAYRITDVHPKGDGAVLAMSRAIENAGLSPEEVDVINAHGTSTVQNDLSETLAIKRVFGPRAGEIPVCANKSMLGHTIAAAGAIECILSLMGMNQSILLPTINHEFPDPKCDLDYVPNEARVLSHRNVLSNSFGFGGQNACLCLGRFDE